MKISKINIEKNAEKAHDYLLYKEYWTNGYLKYNVFKRSISFATNNHSEYWLRKIFIYLVDNNFIVKKKIKKNHIIIVL
tara:strand:- start:1850 stop:2086 length:237 start_codon:yes stop_codon:yes gene_type:complete